MNNINMLRDADNNAGFWAMVAASDPAATFTGSSLYVSADNGANYTKLADFATEAAIGYATNALGNFSSGNIPDELNALNVRLYEGSFSSTTYSGMLSGVFALIVGDEVLFSRNAVLQTNGNYTVTGHLRGRRGTEFAMSRHVVNERVVLVNFATFMRIAQVTSDIGVTKLYKMVPAGGTISSVAPKSFKNEGAPLKPYACVQLGGGKEANGDWTLKWVRRTRISGELRDYVDVPLGETTEMYEVEIYSSSAFTTLKRTISGLTSQTATYTSAQQTTDFGVGQSEIFFIVYQISTVVGRGYPSYGHIAVTGTASPVGPPPAPTPAPPPDPSPAPSPAPSPYSGGPITVASNVGVLLQTATHTDGTAYWIGDNPWGAGSLVRGTFTGINGSQYEQYTGVSPTLGTGGTAACRLAWKWPTGTNEVKSYPSVIYGAKPGFYNTWTTPGGEQILLPNGTYSTVYPSGPTPGTFLPRQLPLAPLYSSFNFSHLQTPTGKGHLSYDIWLQSSAAQVSGFGNAPKTHEIMIPLNNWGGYGDWTTRNPAWNTGLTTTIDGYLFHVFYAPDFNGGAWKFIVFQPDNFSVIVPGTLTLSSYINYVTARGWATGNEWCISVELGVEPEYGTGDLLLHNFKVF